MTKGDQPMAKSDEIKIRIGIHGDTGAGKTTFVLGLLENLEEKGGYLDIAAKRYINTLKDQITERGAVRATGGRSDICEVSDLKPEKLGLGDVSSFKNKKIELSLADVQGETIKNLIDKGDKGLIEDVRNCDIYLFFLNPLHKRQDIKKHIDEQIQFAGQLIDLVFKKNKGSGKKYVPMGFVITHDDEIEKLPDKDKKDIGDEIVRFKKEVLKKAREVYKETVKGDYVITEGDFPRFDLTQKNDDTLLFLKELINRKVDLDGDGDDGKSEIIGIIKKYAKNFLLFVLLLLAVWGMQSLTDYLKKHEDQEKEVRDEIADLRVDVNGLKATFGKPTTGNELSPEDIILLKKLLRQNLTDISKPVSDILGREDLDTSAKLQQINSLIRENDDNVALEDEILNAVNESVKNLIIENVRKDLVAACKGHRNLTEASKTAFDNLNLGELSSIKNQLKDTENNAFEQAEKSEKLLADVSSSGQYTVKLKYNSENSDQDTPFIACFLGKETRYMSEYYTNLCSVIKDSTGMAKVKDILFFNVTMGVKIDSVKPTSVELPLCGDLCFYVFKPNVKTLPGLAYPKESNGKRSAAYPPVNKAKYPYVIDDRHYKKDDCEEYFQGDSSLWPFGMPMLYKNKVPQNKDGSALLTMEYEYTIPEVMWSIAEEVTKELSSKTEN